MKKPPDGVLQRNARKSYLSFPPDLIEELQKKMDLDRLAKTGLFIKLDYTGYEPIQEELRLHRAVLDRALLDTFYPIPEIRDEAKDWFSLEDDDFLQACDRAMVEPKTAIKLVEMMHTILVGDKAKFRLGPKKLI